MQVESSRCASAWLLRAWAMVAMICTVSAAGPAVAHEEDDPLEPVTGVAVHRVNVGGGAYTQFCNENGGIEADVTVIRRRDDCFSSK